MKGSMKYTTVATMEIRGRITEIKVDVDWVAEETTPLETCGRCATETNGRVKTSVGTSPCCVNCVIHMAFFDARAAYEEAKAMKGTK